MSMILQYNVYGMQFEWMVSPVQECIRNSLFWNRKAFIALSSNSVNFFKSSKWVMHDTVGLIIFGGANFVLWGYANWYVYVFIPWSILECHVMLVADNVLTVSKESSNMERFANWLHILLCIYSVQTVVQLSLLLCYPWY